MCSDSRISIKLDDEGMCGLLLKLLMDIVQPELLICFTVRYLLSGN